MKMIKINHGGCKRIIEAFDVTYPTVRSALNYKTESVIAKQIRVYAVEALGGKVIEY